VRAVVTARRLAALEEAAAQSLEMARAVARRRLAAGG
jgi:hypothetical protein